MEQQQRAPRSALSKQSKAATSAGTKKSVRFVSPTPPQAIGQAATQQQATRTGDDNNNNNDKSPTPPSTKARERQKEAQSAELSREVARETPEPLLDDARPQHDSNAMPSKFPIEQGVLNDCWLLSAALSFWRARDINTQFATKVSKYCHLIRLWSIGCEWETYRVHQSNLPQSGGVTIHSDFADYVRFVEGAFLGYFNGADSLAKAVGDPVEAFVWLTGGFAERLLLNQSEVTDRRIFTMLVDKSLFSTVQQSNEKQRHSCSVCQWEKLPFGSGHRYLIIDSNAGDDDDSSSSSGRGRNASTLNKHTNSVVNNAAAAVQSPLTSAADGHSAASLRRISRAGSLPTAASSGDSKTELIAQIARTHPNLTVSSIVASTDQRSGVLTGWYTPQRLLSTFDSCTICRPLIHEDPIAVQDRLVQIMSSWIPDFNSGGSRRNLESFAKNPQFIFKLHLVGHNVSSGSNSESAADAWSRIDGTTPWLYMSLAQPFRFDKSNYAHIAFHVYKLPYKEPPTSPLRASFFLHSGELFSSLPYANYSMSGRSYSETAIPQAPATIPRFTSALYRDDIDVTKESSPVVYLLVVPSTYFPVKARTEFLLRVYSEIGKLTFDSAWNYDPKTVNVPWTKFSPEAIDFAPAINNSRDDNNRTASATTTSTTNDETATTEASS